MMVLSFGLLFSLMSAHGQLTSEVPEIVVSKRQDFGVKKNSVERAERLDPERLRKFQAQTFAQMLERQRGIDSQTACAFCGSKRVTINGLKGEHTTLLIDDLALQSNISSIYGLEAIPIFALDSIDVFRGPGAAQTAPESIGGLIKIQTQELTHTTHQASASLAHDGQKNVWLSSSFKVSEKIRSLVGYQYGEMKPIDLDLNRISEAPRQTTQAALLKTTWSDGKQDLSLRTSYSSLETIGGSMSRFKVSSATPDLADANDFPNQDVRNTFIGDERKITDNIEVTRSELQLNYSRQINADSKFKAALGGAWQKQSAIYGHGYDYSNRDEIRTAMAQYIFQAGSNHLLTLGADTKYEKMDSSSVSLYQIKNPPLAQDDLRFQNYAFYAQDNWTLNEFNEIAATLRLDQVQTKWFYLNRTIDQTVVAPRISYKHIHNSILTSRASAGIGYRSPLTLFESQHGTDHNGFVIEIDQLEKSESFQYSLNGQRLDDFFELSMHFTNLKNMAWGEEQLLEAQPTRFRNSGADYVISVYDLSYGRRIKPYWTLEGLFEWFEYPRGYKEKLPVAAVEKRFSMLSNVSLKKWKFSQRLNVIFERDLSAYGYNRHYNRANKDTDTNSPTFEQVTVADPKRQVAPTYVTVDLTAERSLTSRLHLGFSVLNLFNFTQTGFGDSPTTWDLHGDHFHLDNFHIWGPLRGRQIFVTLRGEI